MCDPEFDDIEFNTNVNMPLFNTKCYLLIQIKDYPIGKNIRCYTWFEGVMKEKEILEFIKNSLTLSETYNKYTIHDIKVVSILMTNSMESSEKFGELVLLSINNVFEGNSKKPKKEKELSLKDIKYSELTDKEIEEIDRKLNIEIFKRRNKLNDKEFNFYMENKNEVALDNVKEIYEKCGGDIYKLRKDKIRENIASMLENKKVVD